MNKQNTREKIGEIIGEASMCWSETPTGIFQSDKAVTLIDKLEAIASQSHQQGRMEMAEEILKTKFELNVDGNLFEVINPDIVSKMVTPPTINK